MARTIKHLSDDVVRAFERALKAELELQAAHAAEDWDRAWKASVELMGCIRASKKAVAAFIAALKEKDDMASIGPEPGFRPKSAASPSR